VTETPSARERLLWVVLACLAWKYAATFESAGVSRDHLLPIVLWVTTWAMGLAALVLGLTDRFNHWLRGWPIFGFFTSTFVAYAIVNVYARARDPYLFTTDAHTFMDYAARLFLDGKNPYQWSLSGAFAVHRMPTDLQTPLENAGFSDRLAYPSLSFLYLVPFVKLGVPTSLAYGAALYGCFAVLFWAAPRDLRPLVLLPFFVDQGYLAYAFGGVTDTVWALLLCLAVVLWKRRPAIAWMLVGLACSYKQHACLLAPFLFVRLWRETPAPERTRVLARFVATVGGTFAVLNVPFLLWGPKEFALGMVEPLLSEMVPLGEGPTAFVTLGGASAPKPLFSLFFWGTYFGLIGVCAKWSRGPILTWIAPSLAFFFNYRSLSSYWYFNLLPFVIDVAITPPPETAEAFSSRAKRIAVGYAGAVALAATFIVFYSRSRHADVDIQVHEPMRTWLAGTHRLDLRITNTGKSPVHMRFWMQGGNFQPLPWRIDKGPHSLAPGESGEYSISAVMRSSEFEIMKGGTLTVDDPNSGFRKHVVIPPDDAWGSLRAIANARFRFWDVHSGTPAYWGLFQKGTPGAYALPLVEDKNEKGRLGVMLGVDTDPKHAEKDRLQFCLALTTCWAGPTAKLPYAPDDLNSDEHTVDLVGEFASRSGKLAIWAKTPRDANTVPFTERYGVRLGIGDKDVLLLLGGEPAQGKLDDATPYEVLPGPRDVWARYEIDIDAIEKKYGIDPYPQWAPLFRYPLLDIPIVPMRFGLEYTTRSKDPRVAYFGEIEESIHGKESPDDVYRDLMKHPAQIDMMRAQYELQAGNPSRGSTYMDRAQRLESHPEIDLAAARLAAHHLDYPKAKALFAKVEPERPIDAALGVAWIHLAEREPRPAVEAFERALHAVDDRARERKGRLSGGEELAKGAALTGIAIARAQMSQCDGVKWAIDQMSPREQEEKMEAVKEIKACIEKMRNAP
jgi:uncharacterized membrane protein